MEKGGGRHHPLGGHVRWSSPWGIVSLKRVLNGGQGEGVRKKGKSKNSIFDDVSVGRNNG